MRAVGVFFLERIVANNPAVGDVPASFLGYVLLCHEGNGLGGCCKALNILAKDLLHMSLYFECFNRWQYSKRSPVLLSSTADAKSQRNCSGDLRNAACWVVKG